MLTAFRSRPSGLRTARRQRQRLAAKALWACGAALAAGHAALAVWRMAELAQGPQPSSARVWATLGLTPGFLLLAAGVPMASGPA